MKKILSAGAAFLITAATSAFAADMPVKAPAAAPMAPVAFNRTGCYVGGHAGYGWGRDRNDFGSAVFDGDFLPELGPYNHDTRGGLGGGQIGCNYQFQNNIVLGIEGEFSAANISGSLTTPEDVADPGTFTRFASRNRWDADVAGRFGYAFGNSLIYGKAGVVWGNFRYSETHDDFPTTHACFCTVDIDSTRTGYILGAGWEYAFLHNWTVKVEYNYLGFDSHTIAYPSTGGSAQSFPVRDSINVVKVGVNYLFH
jgi:outer membrane immunogenic protein